MTTTPFIWLGSKRAAKRGVGEKAALLDYATKMSLPVPAGAVLLDEFYQLLLEAEIIYVENGRFLTHDPIELYDALYTAVRFPKLDKPTIIRTAFSDIDQENSFPTGIKLNVDMLDAQQLADSLCELWSLAQPQPVRLDILVMEQVDAELWGTAVTTSTNPTDDICYTNRSGEHTLTLAKLHGWKRPTAPIPPFAKRLQQLLRGVRRTVDHDHLKVHWADDGNICWLQQIIPVEQS